MRISKRDSALTNFSILTLDDDPIMTSTLQAFFQRSGYHVDVEHEPYRAIERVRDGSYDILLLDFLMTPICGDQVVAEIRKFNRDIFIILLTGHKSVAPPIKTIRELDIQGYYEKSDRFDQLELLVESCVKSISQMRTIRNYQNGLSAIMDSLPQIYHLQSLEHIMDSIISTASSLMCSSGGTLEIDRSGQDGVTGGADRYILRTVGTAETPPSLSSMQENDIFSGSSVVFNAPWVMAAIHDNGKTVGLLCVNAASAPKDDQLQLIEVFSRQITVALSNIFLHSVVSSKNEELTRAYGQLRDSYMEIVGALRLLVDARDIYTRGHSDRVSLCSEKIARAMGRDDRYCENVRIAGLFHDIGKVAVSDGILRKNCALTSEEYEIIKLHPQDGARILSAISMFRSIVPIVQAHHERFDGGGYPQGLAGYAIPEEARIIAVADSFDAMTSDRQYRKSLGYRHAVEELERGKGTQFDPHIVDVFLESARESGLSRHFSDHN